MGWNWCLMASTVADVSVVTRANNRSAIESCGDPRAMRVHWIYADLPVWVLAFKRARLLPVQAYYAGWQLVASRIARATHEAEPFDIVHHLTFGTYWMPAIRGPRGVPYLWGPLGGAESTPRCLRGSIGWRGCLSDGARWAARRVSEYLGIPRRLSETACVALSKSEETAMRLRALGARDVRLLSEVAVSERDLVALETLRVGSPDAVTYLSAGRLLHWKGFHLALQAFASLRPGTPVEYWIVGEGPEGHRLRTLAGTLGCESRVRFLGPMRREDLLKVYAQADVFVHPSLHDSGGWACVEAMAARLPVICLAVGGPAVQVTEETGFAVVPESQGQVVTSLADAMLELARMPELRVRMGEAGRARVSASYSAVARGEDLAALYNEMLDHG